MRRLVALDLPAGPAFVGALERSLARGDAVLPVDQRLPGPAREALFAEMRPGVVIDAAGNEHELASGIPVEAGDAVVIATSGSTGTPKGVVLTMDAVIASARATSERIGVDPSSDRWLACLPVAHIGGLSVILRALLTGTALEVHDGFDREAVLSAARERHASLVSLVPTALLRLGAEAEIFRTIVLGGSAMPDSLPANVATTYGMTETGSGVVYDGRPLSGVQVRIGAGEEIFLKAEMLLRTYRNGSDPKDKDGWLATGDAGAFHEGVLSVRGRIAEVIVSGGEKIWPEAVEAVLRRHQALGEVAVFGRADPEWGERVCVAVVRRDNLEPPSLEELRDLVKAEMGAFAAPKELIELDALPRTALGKLRRSAIAEVLTTTGGR